MLNNNIEIWKQCTPIHEVSNLGRVRNIDTKQLLTLQISTTGYYYFTIRNFEGKKRKHLRVHQIVAKAFIPNPKQHLYVNHINGIKLDNDVENLEWCSHDENMKHASKSGLFKTEKNLNRPKGNNRGKTSSYHYVSYDKYRNKWVGGISIKGKRPFVKRFDTELEAAAHVNWIIDELQLTGYPKNII